MPEKCCTHPCLLEEANVKCINKHGEEYNKCFRELKETCGTRVSQRYYLGNPNPRTFVAPSFKGGKRRSVKKPKNKRKRKTRKSIKSWFSKMFK